MRRSTFFKAAAGAGLAVGAGALFGGPQGRSAMAGLVGGGEKARAPVSAKVADLTGPGLTDRFRMASTDLGIPVTTPDGRLLFVFGDSYEHARGPDPQDFWRSPTALYADASDVAGGVRWTGAVGGDTAEQLWPYEHVGAFTVLPSDAVVIGDTIYLHAMANEELGKVTRTELWKSTDNGQTWGTEPVALFDAGFRGTEADPNPFQLLTWALGDDGWVHIYSTEFGRRMRKMYHFRVHRDHIENPEAYESWGAAEGGWAWGNPPTPVMDADQRIEMGEMCLRPLGGKWVLTFFNNHPDNSGIEGIVVDRPDADLTTAPRTMLIRNTAWGDEDDSKVAQVYGGYIIPGSTLETLHLTVSQWNTGTDTPELDPGWPYRVMQFRIDGFAA
ncbi:uncharacterized protein DUF4185 [Murinocardiopsis flavida]|uniref:Uncharacterized protein DUF4185 n=1 Tax=Murinocardiopsis flavida TaxID=645275 RepID=A0A2P8DML6_9ACTN|nr:DUF4185 domain-containing protein [Murinocardiopsis flavida]PSK98447.1 uncharacterized protein DUF4185 [Murinocardiopsis flavida]